MAWKQACMSVSNAHGEAYMISCVSDVCQHMGYTISCMQQQVFCADLCVWILACFQGCLADALLEGWWEQAPNESQGVSHRFGLSPSAGLQQGLQHLMKKRKVLIDHLASCIGSCRGVITCQINDTKGRRGTQKEGEEDEEEEEVVEERKTERKVWMRMRSRKVHMQAAH